MSNFSFFGKKKTVSSLSASGFFNINQHLYEIQNNNWPGTADIFITNLNTDEMTAFSFASGGNLVMKVPGYYLLNFNVTLTKVVKMWGAAGASATVGGGIWGKGGGGGAAVGTITFNPGTNYYFYVPATGLKSSGHTVSNLNENFVWGAGIGGSVFSQGISGSGGGFAMISGNLWNTSSGHPTIILMAGGGGGGASSRGDTLGGRSGTAGGGTAGQTLSDFVAGSGNQSAGGAAAGSGSSTSGTAMRGGNGSGGGAGGGGGYYGGGGGGTQGDGGYGGGGGSGYVNISLVTSHTLYTGSGTSRGNNSDANHPGNDANLAIIGEGGSTGTGNTGGGGAIVIIA
jgi:hypothetical protein